MYANGRDAPARRDHVRSRAIAAETASLIPSGVNSSLRFTEPPLVFTRANGSRVIDADGNEYVDFHNAFGP